MVDIAAVLGFLSCRTPAAWIERATTEIPTLLLDHASLELRAAQQAQKIIWKYGWPRPHGAGRNGGATGGDSVGWSVHGDAARLELLDKMSRLAREELRHFEQVIAILGQRGIPYAPIAPSRYAAGLHEHIGEPEPVRFIDTLIVAAIIEARSCERFACLLPGLEATEPALAAFYASLLKSEARHFADYLGLAEKAAAGPVADRVERLLALEANLILSPDPQLRFHSGVPA